MQWLNYLNNKIRLDIVENNTSKQEVKIIVLLGAKNQKRIKR